MLFISYNLFSTGALNLFRQHLDCRLFIDSGHR